MQTNIQRNSQQNMKCMLAQMCIINSRYHRLYNVPQQPILSYNISSVSHKRKKVNQKLTGMYFLKDNRTIVLGYDKAAQRGDINFLDVSQPKISDFYYNKLNSGIGGLAPFDDGRYLIIADKKGALSYVDLSKGPNINQIMLSSTQTPYQGMLDLALAPSQTKIACGMGDGRCIILDIGKEKKKDAAKFQKNFSFQTSAINCVNWHPFKSLILSSSLDLKQRLVLWDPHSQRKIQAINYHNNATVTRSQFHPDGNSFFSMGRDNMVFQYQIRFPGFLNKFKLDTQPTAVQIMQKDYIVIGESSGNLSWYDKQGMFIKRIQEGSSGVVRLATDSTRSLLAVARQRQHTFDFYTHSDPYNLHID